jgi:LEA14-like dessication related protein
MGKRVFSILLVVLSNIIVGGCENVQDVFAVQKPKATLQGFQIEDVGLDSATLLFDVKLDNPYPVALPLLNMDYAVDSGANKLFSGEADIQTTIPAKESKTISLPARVSYLDLVRAFKDIRPGTKIPYNADVGLSVDTPALGQLRLPLSKTGELDVPSVPKIDDIDFRRLLDKASQL